MAVPDARARIASPFRTNPDDPAYVARNPLCPDMQVVLVVGILYNRIV